MKYTWLVEKYLEGELSGEALRKFEFEILTKAEVAKEVEKIRSMNRFMQEQHQRMQNTAGLIEDFEDIESVLSEQDINMELEGLKIRKISSPPKDIADLHTKIVEFQVHDTLNKHQSNKVLVRKVSIWMASASIAVLIAVSSLLLFGDNSIDYDELYNQFFIPHFADVERSAELITEDPFREALKTYNNSDFARAFQLLDAIPEEEVNNNYYLYKGITAMELGKFSLAIELFNNLDDDVYLKHEGRWLKSLCYLGMKDEQATRKALNEIIRSDGYYKNMATALLRKL